MPEILTKHPDIVVELLNKEGIICGQGSEQRILKKCPKESFCALKNGELCIYGLKQFSQMTQIKREDICENQGLRYNFVGFVFFFVLGIILMFIIFRKNKLRKM